MVVYHVSNIQLKTAVNENDFRICSCKPVFFQAFMSSLKLLIYRNNDELSNFHSMMIPQFKCMKFYLFEIKNEFCLLLFLQ